MADAISIEETNRIRVSLGMKPLPVPGAEGPVFKESTLPAEDVGSTLESRQAEGYDNYRRLQEAEAAKRKRDAKSEAIKKARDAAKRFAQLEGKGLGEADGDDDDAKAWLIKQKRRQKEIEKARKKEQELLEAEEQAVYSAKDLAGVKVGHEFDTFEDGDEQVLILKDTTIDENEEEGDELENLDLREREKLKEKLELKKKKPIYNPNDDDDGTRGILAHYDEEIGDKKKGTRFTLDGSGSTAEAVAQGEIVPKSKPKVFSLDLLKDDEPKSDYLDISEIKIKKPKKKKRSTRQKAVDEDDILHAPEVEDAPAENEMDVDQPFVAKKRTYEDASFVDDEDLQASLAAQRRNALKKRQKLRPEEIVQRMKEEESTAPQDVDAETGEGGLVIDETSEFVANLQKPSAPTNKQRSQSRQPDAVTAMDVDSDDEEDTKMQSYADIEDEEDRVTRIKREESESQDVVNNGLDEEATLDKGIGSTLKLLRERNILKSENSTDLNEQYRRRQLFMAEKQRQESEAEKKARHQRERDRATGRLDRMSAREKEEYARQQNNHRDQQESRLMAEHFNKSYKPNVELKYHDEHGRSLNQKEAFKQMSHAFHGKGSGKQKTEKLLKKIEDEKRREAQSTLDGSQMGGMTGATVMQSKKQRQAGVRLA